jgi:hypothetical protein
MIGASKPNVFLSYSRADSEKVSKLRGELSRAGFDVWMDRSAIVGGDWRTAIKRGLRRSNFFLACLSTAANQPGEVLQFEWDSALEVQKEQLEGEVYLIPVRLEPCDVPEKMQHLQWIDLYEPDGFQRLLRVLRTKQSAQWMQRSVVAAIALLLLASGAAVWWLSRERPVETFVAFRPNGKSNGSTSNNFMLGVTLWKLRPVLATDPPFARYLTLPPASSDKAGSSGKTEYTTPVRLSPGDLKANDRIFFSVESSRNGYLYVADRELRSDGTKGAPLLIFPATRVNGGDFAVSAGNPLEVPDRFTDPNYFQVTPGLAYRGEELTFFVSPTQVPGIPRHSDPIPISEELVQSWEKWNAGVREIFQDRSGLVITRGEARIWEERAPLRAQDAAPQMIYSARKKAGEAMAVNITLSPDK